MFFGGKIKTMPPKLLSDNQKHMVIRPLAYCREKDIAEFAAIKQYPIIPCNLCGSQTNLQRQAMKSMLQQWDKQFPGRLETIFTSMQNIQLSQMADTSLFDFLALDAQQLTEN
jgi:tRNA 2-thiocytidine biosynthesis protein TtcA